MRSRLPGIAIAAAIILLPLQFVPSVASVSDVTQPPPVVSPWESLRRPFSPAPTRSVSLETLKTAIASLGIPRRFIHVADTEYMVVDFDWWKGFNAAWPAVLRASEFSYKSEVEDCDDFSRFYAMAAVHAFRIQYPGITRSLMVGEFWYQPDSLPPLPASEPHAISLVGIWKDGKLCVLFVEPQTGRPMNLSVAERESCFFARF